ncbi:MAG: hypothetical protein R2806_10415 [Saprospiraceae bacterium]
MFIFGIEQGNHNRKSRPWEVDWSQLTKNIPAGQIIGACRMASGSSRPENGLRQSISPATFAYKTRIPATLTVALLATPEYQMA